MHMDGDLVMVHPRSFLVFCITVLLFNAECTVSGHEFNVTDLLVFYGLEYDDYACQWVTVVNYDTIHDVHGGKLKCFIEFKMSVPQPLIEATVVSSEDVLDGAIGGATVRSSTHERVYTDKGLKWQIEQRQQDFRALVSSWRRQASWIECLLSDLVEISQLKKERDTSESVMTQVTDSYNRPDELLSVADRKGSVYGKFETIESENFDLLRKVSEYTREIDDSKARSKIS